MYKLSGFGGRVKLGQPNQETYPYFKNTALLTPAEISFRHSLKIVVGDSYDINSKVRLADLISVHKGLPKSEWSRSFNQIKAKHVDFILVDKTTTEILCGIELDDSSHNNPKRQNRDSFLDAAMKSAKLPLLRFKAEQTYNSKEIEEAINLVLKPSLMSPDESEEIKVRIEPDLDVNKIDEFITGKCPQCNAELVERKASKGRHEGVRFLGCSNFPKCRYRKVLGESN
tara:strand:+ start:416 stop:1099 length:684 start_codon:yes stop_codon:yes gene_type:complete